MARWQDLPVGAADQHLHVMDATTWEPIRALKLPGVRPHGVGWDKEGRLWVADTTAGTVTAMNTETGHFHDAFRVAEPDEVHGMTIRNGDEFWYCDAISLDIGVLVR